MKQVLLGGVLLLLLCSTAFAGGQTEAQQDGKNVTMGQQENAGAAKAAVAAENATAKDDDVHELAPVVVEEEKHELGKATIGRTELKGMPTRSGSITEALQGMPNVQFSNDMDSSLNGGEIRPPRISINGAKPYENNFMIDGMSITNTLNPSGLDSNDDGYSQSAMDVKGGDQTIFYDTSLLDSITVHSSNVPAKYGNFVGGVVESKLRDPKTDRWHGMVRGGHTRDNWANLRGPSGGSDSSESQPKYRIYDMAASAEGPITDKASVLFSIARRQSDIPLTRVVKGGKEYEDEQHRQSDNYFAKLMLTPSDDLKLTFDATYAPYSEKRWREAWEDSEWELYNNSKRFATGVEYDSDYGLFMGRMGYSMGGYSRDAESAYVRSGGDSQSGGVGDAKWDSREFNTGLDWESEDFEAGPIDYSFSAGFDFTNKIVDSENEASKVDILVQVTPVFSILTQSSYHETEQTNELNKYGYYGDVTLEWDRLTVVPGFRVDYNDFSHNTDIAYRLKAEYDTLGDGKLRVVGGANRYYGSQLEEYAFDRYRPANVHQERDTNGDGIPESTRDWVNSDKSYDVNDVDTPYSDEFTGGIAGTVWGFEYGLNYVHRKHNKQIVSKKKKNADGDNDVYLENEGSSIYDGITLTLAKSYDTEDFGNHTFRLGATQSRTKTFKGAYDEEHDLDSTSSGVNRDFERVYYNGELIDRDELPADNYNAPLVLTFGWDANFFEDTLRLNTNTRWKDSTTGLGGDSRYSRDTPHGTTSGSNSSTSTKWIGPSGDYHEAYEDKNITGGMTTNVGFEYDILKKEYTTLTLEFDVFNIFDASNEVGIGENEPGQTGEIIRGRSFYAGIRAEF